MKAFFSSIKNLFKPIDLTSGSTLKVILIFSLPILINAILNNAFSLVNSLVLKSTVGGDSVASISVTGSISSLLFNFAYGCSSGFSVITSNKYGAKDYDGVRKNLNISLFLGLIIGIVITTIGLICLPYLFSFLNVSPIYYDMAYQYFVIILIYFVVTVLANILGNFIIALGNSTIPLFFSICATLINIGLGYLLTGVITLGTRGVAIASMSATIFNFTALILYIRYKYKFIKLRLSDLKADKKTYMNQLKLSLPLGFQWSILFVGSFIQSSQVNLYGGGLATKAAACYGSFESYLTIPFSVISQALLNFVGQNYGAKKLNRIKDGIIKCIYVELVCYIVVLIIAQTTKELVPYIFLPDEDLADAINGPKIIYYTATYIGVMSPFLICQGILQISRSSLQGIKRPLIPFLSGVGELAARSFVCFILPSLVDPANPLSDKGYFALCFSTPLAWIFSVIIMGGSVLHIIYLNKNFADESADKVHSKYLE